MWRTSPYSRRAAVPMPGVSDSEGTPRAETSLRRPPADHARSSDGRSPPECGLPRFWYQPGVLELRPLDPADAAELRRIRATPEVAGRWDEPEDDFPLHDDPESVRLTILVDGAVAGLIQ